MLVVKKDWINEPIWWLVSVRPAENASAPVNVTFDMSIHHIIDVDEKNQVLTMNCWLTQV